MMFTRQCIKPTLPKYYEVRKNRPRCPHDERKLRHEGVPECPVIHVPVVIVNKYQVAHHANSVQGVAKHGKQK